MNNQDQHIAEVEQQIEISIEQAKEQVDRKDMMNDLIEDVRFKELFTVGYLEHESSRLVSLLADSEHQTAEKQKELVDDMRAISGFRQYILNIKALGRQMENQIERSQAELNDLREGA